MGGDEVGGVSLMDRRDPGGSLVPLPREVALRRWCLWVRKRVLTRHRIHWQLDLGLPAFNCEK